MDTCKENGNDITFNLIDRTLLATDVKIENHKISQNNDYFSDHIPVSFQVKQAIKREIRNEMRSL